MVSCRFTFLHTLRELCGLIQTRAFRFVVTHSRHKNVVFVSAQRRVRPRPDSDRSCQAAPASRAAAPVYSSQPAVPQCGCIQSPIALGLRHAAAQARPVPRAHRPRELSALVGYRAGAGSGVQTEALSNQSIPARRPTQPQADPNPAAPSSIASPRPSSAAALELQPPPPAFAPLSANTQGAPPGP